MSELEVSETGRAIRSDSLEGKYGTEFLKELIIKYYVNELMSSTKAASIIREKHNVPITPDKILKLTRKIGITRGKSEAVSLWKRGMSYESVMNDELKSVVDGLLMGDGCITIDDNTKVGRLSLGSVHKEFAQYCSNLLKVYGVSEPSYRPGEKGLGMWSIRTFSHPDFYVQRQRWYPNGKKDVPSDVVFDKMFMVLWYLGDGCLSSGSETGNSRYLYFATQGFPRKSLEEIVVPKFGEIGVEVRSVNKDNCVNISAISFWDLLKFMGGESPVGCFDYKFDLEEWRKLPGMHEVSEMLNLDYQKLSYWVKVGVIEHSRSPGGKKVVFTEDEILNLRARLDSGELPRESGKRVRKGIVGFGLSSSISALGEIRGKEVKATDFVTNILKNKNGEELSRSLRGKEMIPVSGESDDEFLDRVVKIYQKAGFPFPIVDESRKLKLWHGLRKTMSPEFSNEIKWRSHGTTLATSYHQHIYSLNSKSAKSPIEVYEDKSLFKNALKKYKEFGGRLTYGGILQSLCRYGGAGKINNYSPLIARDIINHYGFNDMKLLDPCAGFGGRLIGASVSRNRCSYTGIEPSSKTLSGLYDTQRFLLGVQPLFSSTILSGCAEDIMATFRDGFFDVCFTSPPYFDTENYSDEENQSSKKYDTYELWMNGFIKVVLSESFRVLKNDGKAIFQVGSVAQQNFPEDFIKIAENVGFKLFYNHPVVFKALPYVGHDNFNESLLVFTKP